VSKIGKVANICILYQQFADGGTEQISILAPWMKNNQTKLNALYNVPIEMANTSYGRFFVQQKRDVKQGYQKMSAKEKVDSSR
jgi:hypothetical protein